MKTPNWQEMVKVQILGRFDNPLEEGAIAFTKDLSEAEAPRAFYVEERFFKRNGSHKVRQQIPLSSMKEVSLRRSRIAVPALLLCAVSIVLAFVAWNPVLAFSAWSFRSIARRHHTVIVLKMWSGETLQRTIKDTDEALIFRITVEQAILKYRAGVLGDAA